MDIPKTIARPFHLVLATAGCLLLLGACGDDAVPTQPQSVDPAPASAAAGAIDIDQVLAFNAQRSTNGDVKGRLVYHQTAFGETFSAQADVSCIGV